VTDAQKEKIAALRGSDATYSSIAASVGLTESAVKTYCFRHKIAAGKAMKPGGLASSCCLNCGKSIAQAEKKKHRKFCCGKCRETWWNHNRESGNGGQVSLRCAFCGEWFKKYANSPQKYCSHKCYIANRFSEVKADNAL
jgi:endogenous inhibitor of DNA gyrase (YacG/DUF329 family)